MIAWRYLRAKRAEGGISVMTWISVIGITLAVFALIATLAVRAGFRAEFVDTIIGANPHVTVYGLEHPTDTGGMTDTIPDYETLAAKLAKVPGVTSAAPVVVGEVMASANGHTAGIQVTGITEKDLETLPRIVNPQTSSGSLDDFAQGIALGVGVAQTLGVSVGDTIKLISPEGTHTPFGVSPRVASFKVTYIFTAGRYDIDQVRAYMPFSEAQDYFNRQGVADRIEIMVKDPEAMDDTVTRLWAAVDGKDYLYTWQQMSGAFLRALTVEDNVMFVLLSVLVLIATMNIVSGLIMLVKNKTRDIGILRTLGLSQGSILRIFLMCGVITGVAGTVMGVILGCIFAIYIGPIFKVVNYLSGGGVWDPSIRGIYYLPAKLQFHDVMSAVIMSLGMACIVTIFPARRAARLNPVEALRNE